MYQAHCRRLEVDRATDVKNAMISGLWSNSNLDDDKNTRQNALTEIEESYQETIRLIYSRESTEDPEIDIDELPFFKAMNFDWAEAVPDRTTTN